jgi:phage terminase large subunit
VIKFSEKYKPLFTSDLSKIRYIILTGGRASGKSFAANHFLHDISFQNDHVILSTRFTMTSAKISIIPELTSVIEARKSEYFFKITENQIINNFSNATINFKGLKTGSLQQTAQLKSVNNLNIWLLDEAEELHDESLFDDVDESIRRKGYNNIIVLLLNTYRITKDHFIYKKFFEKKGIHQDYFNGLKDNVLYIHTSYLDNIHNLNSSFLHIVEETKKNDYEKYEYRFLGKFRNRAEGVIFDNWEIGDFDNSLPYNFGLDFGVIDPDALVKVAIDRGNKKIYVKECIYENNLNSDQLFNKIGQHCKRNELIIADNAGKRSINDLRQKGFNCIPVSKYAGQIIFLIKEMLNYKMIVTPESHNIIKELNNYCWSDKKGEIPIDDFNHGIDAIRYALSNSLKRNTFL